MKESIVTLEPGDHCEINVDDCMTRCGDHGTCVDSVDSYTSHFTGTACEVKLSDVNPTEEHGMDPYNFAYAVMMLEFQNVFHSFLKESTAKILERCPLKYPVVRYLMSIDPRFMYKHPNCALQRFEKLLSKLLECRALSEDQCDSSKQQYESFLKEAKLVLGLYKIKEPLDTFFKLLNEREENKELWNVCKMMFVISHGQADIERGFSVNKDIANDNMLEETFVAYRRVYQGVTGFELCEPPITKEMLVSCRQSRQKYYDYLDNQKKLNKQLKKLL